MVFINMSLRFFGKTKCAIMQPSMSKLSSLWVRIAPIFLLFFLTLSFISIHPHVVSAQGTTPTPTPTPATDGTGEGEVSDESCESAGGDFSFGLCPLLRLSNEGIQLMDRRIRSALEVNPKYFEPIENADGDQVEPIRSIWGTFRNIAAILLLPILLVLVIGTALGFSVVDAYTVKRAMPRLFIAVIFMALSYDICIIMIDVTTALGRGIGGIVAAPFGGVDNLTLPAIFMPPGLAEGGGGNDGGGFVNGFTNILMAPSNVTTDAVKGVAGAIPGADTAFAIAGGLLAAVSLGAAGIFTIGILASFFFVGLVLLIIIFAILAIRELVIVFLVVIAPLAILSWIFPGNDKLWKVWWDTFTKLLMVYPVIMALIMLGRGFAGLINQIGDTIDPQSIEMVFFVITKLAVYIGPFFLIMFVLKILTGAFGTFTGMVNDKRRGFFDRQRNYRTNARKQKVGEFMAGQRGPRVNRAIGENIGHFKGAKSKTAFLASGRYREASKALTSKRNEAAHANTDEAKLTQENDGMLQAATYNSAREARENMARDFQVYRRDVNGNIMRNADGTNMVDRDAIETAIAQVEASGGFNQARRNFATRQLSKTGTGYANEGQMQTTVARVARTESEAADLLGEINATTKGANRHDLAVGYGNQMAIQRNIRARIAQAGGIDRFREQLDQLGQETFMSQAEMDEAHAQALSDIDAVTAARQKPTAVRNMTRGARVAFQTAQAMGDTQRTAAWAGHIDKLEQAGTYSSMTNAQIAGQEVITPTAGYDGDGNLIARPETLSDGQRVLVATEGRAAVKTTSSPNQLVVNPVTNTLEPVSLTQVTGTDPAGNPVRTPIIGPNGRPVRAVNFDHDRETEEIYKRHNTSQPQDPNNPFLN